MAYTGDIGNTPDDLECFATWEETQQDNVVKSTFEDGTVKFRRRFTGTQRRVQATVTHPARLFNDFEVWFNQLCRQGSIPCYIKTPYGTTELFQFMAPPQYSWNGPETFTASCTFYQGAGWR